MKLNYVSRTFLLDHNNDILLVKHKDSDIRILPWGHAKQNESPASALRRELKEELWVWIELLWIRNITNDQAIFMQPLPISIHELEYYSKRKDAMVRNLEFWYFSRIDTSKEIKTNKEIGDHKRCSILEILSMKVGEEVYQNMVDVLKQNEDLLELL